MSDSEKEKLNKQMKIYEKLGAVKFQKVVFKVEKLKFKIIKKLFPNFIKNYDKYIDFCTKKALKNARNDDERKKIQSNAKYSKMAMRKEYYTEKNRNYHISLSNPTEIEKYLKWNKNVHKKGLITNMILIPILIAAITMEVPFTMPFLILEFLSAGINFECINIQNYNLCRFKKIEKSLKRRHEKNVESEIKDYGKAAEVIYNSLEMSDEKLPTIEEIISNITTKEQAEQMKELLLKAKRQRTKEKEKTKIYN